MQKNVQRMAQVENCCELGRSGRVVVRPSARARTRDPCGASGPRRFLHRRLNRIAGPSLANLLERVTERAGTGWSAELNSYLAAQAAAGEIRFDGDKSVTVDRTGTKMREEERSGAALASR